VEDLLHTYTADGLMLEGARHGPSPTDVAIVYTHGITSSVFRKTHVLIGRALGAVGWPVIAGNNRGAALAYPLLDRSGARVLGGAWFERLEEAALDIDAWIEVALAAGARRIVLLGHSLGAIKALVYASEHPDRGLAGLVLASAPLRAFASPPRPDVVAAATTSVADGRPQQLLDLPAAGLTFGRMSAATVLSRASIGDPTPRVRSIACPILALYGTEEVEFGGQGDLDRLGQLAGGRFTGALVAGANHIYAAHESEAASLIDRWIASVITRAAAERVSR